MLGNLHNGKYVRRNYVAVLLRCIERQHFRYSPVPFERMRVGKQNLVTSGSLLWS